MKKSAMIVCLLLALSLLAGCLKDEVGGVRLSSDGPVEMYSVPRQVAVMLFHTGGAWTATTDATWLKVKKESGTGGTDTLIIVTTEKNLTGAPRTALVAAPRRTVGRGLRNLRHQATAEGYHPQPPCKKHIDSGKEAMDMENKS